MKLVGAGWDTQLGTKKKPQIAVWTTCELEHFGFC